MHHTNIYRE